MADKADEITTDAADNKGISGKLKKKSRKPLNCREAAGRQWRA